MDRIFQSAGDTRSWNVLDFSGYSCVWLCWSCWKFYWSTFRKLSYDTIPSWRYLINRMLVIYLFLKHHLFIYFLVNFQGFKGYVEKLLGSLPLNEWFELYKVKQEKSDPFKSFISQVRGVNLTEFNEFYQVCRQNKLYCNINIVCLFISRTITNVDHLCKCSEVMVSKSSCCKR